MQCVAVCYSVLQCVAVCCSVLQRAAVRFGVLQYVAVCCSVLHCVAAYYSVLQCGHCTFSKASSLPKLLYNINSEMTFVTFENLIEGSYQ